MTDKQRNILQIHGTDVDGALYRFGGNEKIYVSCLSAFLEDSSMQTYKKAMAAQAWADACIAVHTLKGTAGNMGFIPLMNASGQMVALLRAGQYQDAEDGIRQLERHYSDILDGITAFLAEKAGKR